MRFFENYNMPEIIGCFFLKKNSIHSSANEQCTNSATLLEFLKKPTDTSKLAKIKGWKLKSEDFNFKYFCVCFRIKTICLFTITTYCVLQYRLTFTFNGEIRSHVRFDRFSKVLDLL